MGADPFLDRQVVRVPTSAGDAAIPTIYRDAAALYAFYHVEYEHAAGLLEGTPLTPARLGRSGALAGVAAFDYRDTTIGPYREVAVGLAVVPRGVPATGSTLLHLLHPRAHRDVALHVLDMPVTSPVANAGGRELWGFPKFVTAIEVDLATDHVRAVARVPGVEEAIVTLEGRPGWGISLGAVDPVVYTIRNGELLRTVLEARGRMHVSRGRELTLRIGQVDHPMARRLRTLGLDSAHPMAVQLCLHYQVVLPAGEPFRVSTARAA